MSDHYRKHPSGVECMDIVKHFPFAEGNVMKYIWRAGIKTEDKVKDLVKAREYIDVAIQMAEGEAINKESPPTKRKIPPRPDQGDAHGRMKVIDE